MNKMAAGAASSVFLPPCMRVTEPHVTILGGLREVDFDAIRRDLQSDDQPDHFDLQFGRVAVWNRHTPPRACRVVSCRVVLCVSCQCAYNDTRTRSGYYAVVVVNVAATKPMNDLFRRLGRHPTQSTSDKGRNNYKPHLTIAYIRKDKALEPLSSEQPASVSTVTAAPAPQGKNPLLHNGSVRNDQLKWSCRDLCRGGCLCLFRSRRADC